jgi:hypothetical protein
MSLMSDLILFVQCGKESADMKGTNAYDTAIKLIECQLFLHYLMLMNLYSKVSNLLQTTHI